MTGRPKKEKRDLKDIKQVPFRLHINDYKLFKSKLALEPKKITVQSFVEACVIAYLEGDDYVKNLVREYKILSDVDKKTQSWSKREQERLLDEIDILTEQ